MELKNEKEILYSKLKEILYSDDYRHLRFVFLISTIVSIYIRVSYPNHFHSDTNSFTEAGNYILQNWRFDSFRTPLYPLFLSIGYQSLIITVQYGIFLISIYFFHSILKMLTSSSLLIFSVLLIYGAHPIFTLCHNIFATESFSLSLSTVYIYFLIRYIKGRKKKDCCLFHLMMLILIFIKPAFLFLFAISIALFVYLVFKKRPVYPLKIYFISLCLSLSVVGSYAFLMHKQYGVYSISSVSDINMYWMLRPNDLIDISSIENPEIKEYVAEKEANTIYEHNWQYYYEAQEIISAYSWKEFHLFIQSSLKKHFPSFLFGEKITRMRLESLNDRVGLFDTDPFPDFQPYHPFTFHHLLVLLGLYFGMIVFRWVKRKTVPVIPILFLFYVFLNLFTILYAAPEYYGRLIIPSLTVILLIIMQILEFVIHSMKRLKIRSI